MDTLGLLRDVFHELITEVRDNDDFRDRLEKVLEKHTAAQWPPRRPHRRKPGLFDPMIVYGESRDALRTRLSELNNDELKDIIAEHGMDRSKLAMKWKKKDRLIDLIVVTAESRAHKGDAFRT